MKSHEKEVHTLLFFIYLAEKDEGSDKEEPAEREESINETLMSELTTFRTENKRLHEMTTNLHQRHHQLTLKVRYIHT